MLSSSRLCKREVFYQGDTIFSKGVTISSLSFIFTICICCVRVLLQCHRRLDFRLLSQEQPSFASDSVQSFMFALVVNNQNSFRKTEAPLNFLPSLQHVPWRLFIVDNQNDVQLSLSILWRISHPSSLCSLPSSNLS